MSENRNHHISRKNIYSVLVVPNGETGKSKNFQVAPWQIVLASLVSIGLVVASVLLVLIYTPAGSYVPIANPYLENKYSKQLVELSQRMTGVLEQLMELRTYNVRLRKALGEEIAESDSGIVGTSTRQRGGGTESMSESGSAVHEQVSQERPSELAANYHPAVMQQEAVSRLSFPAIMPLTGYTTRSFDPDRGHFGLDIVAKMGTTITAAADGYVVFSGWTHDDGYQVIISHTGGFLSFYKHNQSLLKLVNAYVRRGDPIALLGNSGETSSGPHVHFEVWKNGVPVDPRFYLLNYNL
jgi:murein DD-endopeptidase MepM/ murein hydrolase activator NlpD